MKYIYLKVLPIVLVVLLLCGCATVADDSKSASNHTNTFTNEQVKKYKSDLKFLLDGYSDKFSGQIFIARDGNILYDNSFGTADYKTGRKIDQNTTFSLGTGSFPFTATAIMMLQETGDLKVEDKISKYVPDYPYGENITIENLLTGSSGMPNYLSDDNSLDKSKQYTFKDILNLIINKPLDFQPGTKISNGFSDFAFLGYIIEKVSGQSYQDFITENIFKPLEMNNSGFYSQNTKSDNKAVGYDKLVPEPVESPVYDPSILYPAGDMYSTAEDLYKFDRILYTEKLLKKSSIDKMLKGYIEAPDGYSKTGFGWVIQPNNSVYITGCNYGFYSSLFRDLDKNQVIIILSNLDTKDPANNGQIGNIIKMIQGTLYISNSP
ncbi:MAG: serine hydrolase domain-containing protein [Bacillota bacterium]|nr:serine hydrolase domain-containing protein [Bacillota bacterium]